MRLRVEVRPVPQFSGLLLVSRTHFRDGGSKWGYVTVLAAAGAELREVEYVNKLQTVILSAELERSHAVTSARIANEELATLEMRMTSAQVAQEAALQRADALTVQLAATTSSFEAIHDQAHQHAGERSAASARRIAALSDELQRVHTHVAELTVALHTSTEAESSHASTAAELGSALRSLQTEVDQLVAQRDGLQMELAGTAQRADAGTPTLEARDAAIQEFMTSKILPLVQYGYDCSPSWRCRRMLATGSDQE